MPAKAAYLALEHDSSLEFEFFLAEKLGMTVARLRAEMSNLEFVRWNVYYARERQREELEHMRAEASSGR